MRLVLGRRDAGARDRHARRRVLGAVRQYSIFDYPMTSVAFLMFSMPCSASRVMLKTYGIQFNNLLQRMGFDRWMTTAGPPPGGFSGGFGTRSIQLHRHLRATDDLR